MNDVQEQIIMLTDCINSVLKCINILDDRMDLINKRLSNVEEDTRENIKSKNSR